MTAPTARIRSTAAACCAAMALSLVGGSAPAGAQSKSTTTTTTKAAKKTTTTTTAAKKATTTTTEPAPSHKPGEAAPLLDPSRLAGLTEGLAARVGLDRRLGKSTGVGDLGNACVSVETPRGEVLYTHDGQGSFIPASTAKLFTSLAAFSALGPTTRFRTEVWEKDGTIYLKGGGDPVLATPDWIAQKKDHLTTPLADLAQQARQARSGIRTFVADAGELDTAPEVDGWEPRYMREGTAPRLSALAVDRSRATPKPDWPKVARGQGDADLEAAAAFAALYGADGASVTRGSVPEGATQIASIESPPLSDIITEMNTYSDNFVAETLLRQVGKRRSGTGTTEAGVAAETQILSDLGVDLSGVSLHDGSGLHRDSRVSCDAFLDLLEVGTNDPGFGQAFATSLATGGGDGTLQKRDLSANVRAKTGTLNDVSNIVGIAGSADGDLYFAVLMNDNTQTTRAHQIQDRIVGDIGAWPQP